jgi:serine/threonine protein kinase
MNGGAMVAPPEAAELRQYSFLKELGQGGSAVVYLAIDREARHPVAIKLLQPSLSTDDETLQRFAAEARTAALLQHPNIVGVHAVKRLRSGGLALVMQYVPGGTLKDLIRRQAPLPVRTVERVVGEIAVALSYAHSKGIVHRDVKPENIFLDSSTGSALLADFGIARNSESAASLTLHGVAVGTPAYMAPEQIDDVGVDGRADLYSLALVAWEMLTGETPWEGESLYGIIYKQKHEHLPSVDGLRSDVPPYLGRALEIALAKQPADRFPDARRFAEALSPPWPLRLWGRFALSLRQLRPTRLTMPAPSAPPAAEEVPTHADPTPEPDGLATVRFVRSAPAPLPAAGAERATSPTVSPRTGGRVPVPPPPPPRAAGAALLAAVVGVAAVVALNGDPRRESAVAPPMAIGEAVGVASQSARAASADEPGSAPEVAVRPTSERPTSGKNAWVDVLRDTAADSWLGRLVASRWRSPVPADEAPAANETRGTASAPGDG